MNAPDNSRFLELNEDEAGHRRQITTDLTLKLGLANEAAALTLTGIIGADGLHGLHETNGTISLLITKAVQNLRFGLTGLEIGYYSGAYAALRASYETLTFVALFSANPDEIPIWIRNEIAMSNSLTPNKKGDGSFKKNLNEMDQQKRRAKNALIKMEKSGHIIKQGLMRYVENCNRHIHTTFRGLAEEFGVEVDQLLPDSLEESFIQMGEDLDILLGPHAVAEFQDDESIVEVIGQQDNQQIVYTQLTGRFDSEILDDIAIFAYYISHRLLDITEETFSIPDEDFMTDYRIWHAKLAELS